MTTTSTPVRRNELIVLILLLTASVLLAGAASYLAVKVEKVYVAHSPYFDDAVGYLVKNIRLSERVEVDGRLSAAWREAVANDRNPARTVPLVLLAPSLLAHPYGFMATAIPGMVVFLFLLGWTLYKRGGHWPYSLAVMSLFMTIPGFYGAYHGLAAYWLDLHASFWIGSAILALFNSNGLRTWRWVIVYALAVALAFLSRFISVTVVMVMTGPIVLFYALQLWRSESWKVAVSRLAAILAIVLALGGYYLIVLGPVAISNPTYAMGNSWRDVIVYMVRVLRPYFANLVPLVLAFLFVLNLMAVLLKQATWVWETRLALVWLAVAQFILLAATGTLQEHTTEYAVIPLFLFLVWIDFLREGKRLRWLRTAISIVVIIVSIFFIYRYSNLALAEAGKPDREAVALKKFDIEVAKHLAEQGDGLAFQTFFDNRGEILTAETFYGHGVKVLSPTRYDGPSPYGRTFFSMRDFAWEGGYPGLKPEEIAPMVYQKADQWLEFVIVFDDPDQALQREENNYAGVVAQYIAKQVRDDGRWEKVFDVEHPVYGKLAGYRHKSPQPDAFDILLRRVSLP